MKTIKTITSILIFGLFSVMAIGQNKKAATIEKSQKNQKSQTTLTPIPVPSCIAKKEIDMHLCNPQRSLLQVPNIVHADEIVLGINPDGTTPGTNCGTNPPDYWTHFKIETVGVYFGFGPVQEVAGSERISSDIPISSLYSIAGSSLGFYELPSDLVTQYEDNFPDDQPFIMKVTITGVFKYPESKTRVESDYSSDYYMIVTRNTDYKCELVLEPNVKK